MDRGEGIFKENSKCLLTHCNTRKAKQSYLKCLPAVLEATCCHSFHAASNNMPSRTPVFPVNTGNNGRVFVEERSHKHNHVIPPTHCGTSHSLEQIQENSP